MAEQQQTSPEAVAALAKVLWLADTRGEDPAWQEMAWADMGGSEASDERAHHEIHAAALLADSGPLLEALAQAGVLEVEHGEKRDAYKHDGGGCFSIHYDPYARLVSPWKPVSES